MDKRLFLLSSALALGIVAGCATTPKDEPVADTVAHDPQLSTLNVLIARAGLSDTLRGAGPYTLFAPTDEAFKAVPAKTMAEWNANPDVLKAVLAYHVLQGKVAATGLGAGKLKTVNGADLTTSRSGSFVTVDDAVVTQVDLMATNGVVHVVDRVMLPPKR